MKHIVFTVTNDLNFDQRMQRACATLSAAGYRCTLVGRQRKDSLPLTTQSFEQKRIPCLFEKGKLFYLEYNLKLLLFLLFKPFDIACAVDLDTILPSILASKLRGKTLVYDAHEYFTEMEEIVGRPLIRKAWRTLEKWAMKRVTHAYTISEGYAKLYAVTYGKTFTVIRNVPPMSTPAQRPTHDAAASKIIQYQGALNVGRGLEEIIAAMPALEGFSLNIYGSGPLEDKLRQQARQSPAAEHIRFMGAVRPDVLRQATREAWVGLCLFSETGLHHRHSLANRFFDHLHAGIPQLAMNYPEYAAFNHRHEVAVLINELTPESVTEAIAKLASDPTLYAQLKANCAQAARENCWERESGKLLDFYRAL